MAKHDVWAQQESRALVWLHSAHNLKRLPTNLPIFSPLSQQGLPPQSYAPL